MATDPKTIRFNDAESPDRLERFERNLKRTANHGGEVLRQLVDAYNRFVEEYGHGPKFPVSLAPSEPDKSSRRAVKKR